MKRFVTIIALGAALIFTSCSDFLEKAPRTSQSTEVTLSTYAGLNNSTLGAYTYLANTAWYGGERILEGEMRSGNGIKDLAHNSNRYTTQYNWNYLADDTSDLWAAAYVTISKCNNVIDNLEGKESEDVSAQDLNNLKAECLFIRALSHFDLVTLFAQPYSYQPEGLGVPVVLHTDPAGKPERAKVKDVYAQVVADLLEAEKIIDPAYKRAGVTDEKAVVSVYAIQALLSRVYLYMGDWNNAAAYATKVIDSNKFSLYTAKEYPTVWTAKTGGSEVIFEVYIDLTNYSNEDCCYMTYPDGAYGDCIASPELYALYADGDVRKECYVKDKAETAGLLWTTKYAGKGLNIPDANNTVVLRLSEMYLNRAEALVNGAQGQKVSALDDLNTIAKIRGAQAYSAAGAEAIRAERRKELAWEGHYFFDLARWKQAVNRPANSSLMAKNQNIPFPDYRWALPIPKRELEVNENLKQNEKY